MTGEEFVNLARSGGHGCKFVPRGDAWSTPEQPDPLWMYEIPGRSIDVHAPDEATADIAAAKAYDESEAASA